MPIVRMDFVQDYTLKSLRLKQDKWNKLVVADSQREYIISFIERGEHELPCGEDSVFISLYFRLPSRADHLAKHRRPIAG